MALPPSPVLQSMSIWLDYFRLASHPCKNNYLYIMDNPNNLWSVFLMCLQFTFSIFVVHTPGHWISFSFLDVPVLWRHWDSVDQIQLEYRSASL